MPRTYTPDTLAAALPGLVGPDARVLVGGCASEPGQLLDAIEAAGAALGAATLTGIVVPGLNTRTGLAPGAATRRETFFKIPELAGMRDRVDFLPLSYTQIVRHYRRRLPDALAVAVSPPDADGLCSFGPTVDFAADLWPEIPGRIAHLNPLLPRTAGPAIPYDAFTAVVEAPAPLLALADPAPDPVTATIAAAVAALIPDGATVQAGVGKLPAAVWRALGGHQDLRVHSGLIGDAVLDLLGSGAIAEGAHVTAGVAIGTARLYDALPASGIVFAPAAHTHAAAVLAALPSPHTVNAAFAVDLYGQGFAEVARGCWVSGTGGATDFARGALAGGGTRIVALPSTAGAASRIVPPGGGEGPVSLARTDIDLVVTEHGVADLRGRDADARAAALIAIAAPDHREALARAWGDGPARY